MKELINRLEENIADCERFLNPGCTVIVERPFVVGLKEYSGNFLGSNTHVFHNPLVCLSFTRERAEEIVRDNEHLELRVLSRTAAVKEWKEEMTKALAAIAA